MIWAENVKAFSNEQTTKKYIACNWHGYKLMILHDKLSLHPSELQISSHLKVYLWGQKGQTNHL